MKKLLTSPLWGACGAVLLLLLLASCSDIEPEDRLVYHPQPQAERAVLIEDFTGQKCVNCPEMADELTKLADNYGHDKVIVVAHHSGSFSQGVAASMNPLRNDESQWYFDYFKMNAQPAVIVNHSGSIINMPNEVAAPLASALAKKTPITIEGGASIDNDQPEHPQLKVWAKLSTVETVENVSLMVWVIENGITAVQFLPGNKVERNYTHNHVFRESLTTVEGANLGTLAAGSNIERNLGTSIKDAWNKDNLEVVIVALKNNVVENVKKIEVQELLTKLSTPDKTAMYW